MAYYYPNKVQSSISKMHEENKFIILTLRRLSGHLEHYLKKRNRGRMPDRTLTVTTVYSVDKRQIDPSNQQSMKNTIRVSKIDQMNFLVSKMINY